MSVRAIVHSPWGQDPSGYCGCEDCSAPDVCVCCGTDAIWTDVCFCDPCLPHSEPMPSVCPDER
jgi:hypothetical protein